MTDNEPLWLDAVAMEQLGLRPDTPERHAEADRILLHALRFVASRRPSPQLLEWVEALIDSYVALQNHDA